MVWLPPQIGPTSHASPGRDAPTEPTLILPELSCIQDENLVLTPLEWPPVVDVLQDNREGTKPLHRVIEFPINQGRIAEIRYPPSCLSEPQCDLLRL